uniref:Uncharacterized protein n=1 Tax=Rhizophora mucronata TaxID=61149 RepID=A0A2P2L3D5_RHIMU
MMSLLSSVASGVDLIKLASSKLIFNILGYGSQLSISIHEFLDHIIFKD